MKKLIFPTVFLVTLFVAGRADADYSISANLLDIQQVCFVTGYVKDGAGNPVHPAEVTVACGSAQVKAKTVNESGAYIANAPTCDDFTITATALGKDPVFGSGISGSEGELVPLDLIFSDGQPSLDDAIRVLQLHAGLKPDHVPQDQTGDKKIRMEDALFILQMIAGLRIAPLTTTATRKAMRSALDVGPTVTVGKDTDGDGVEDWFQTGFADQSGYIEITGLAEGIYSFTATSTDNTGTIRVENIQVAGSSVDLKTLLMKPPGSISGTVQLEGASDHSAIHVYVPGTSYDAYTDSAGNFAISNVPEGTYAVQARMENYGAITMKDVPVFAGQDSVMDPFMLPSVVGSVSGTFRLQDLGNFTGILITLRRDVGTTYLTTTDAYGDYAFYDVPVGSYQLIAIMPGYVSWQTAITVAKGSNLQPTQNLSVNSNRGTLSGTFTLSNVDDHAGVLINVAGTQYLALTDTSGAYTINGVPEGTYPVFVKAEGYGARRFQNIEIRKGQTTLLNGELTAATGTAFGSIVGAAFYSDKTDHSGISVKLEGTDIPLVGTDTTGSFIISNMPAGTYTLLFTQANYKTVKRVGVVVPPWETALVRIVMMIPPVGSIRGKVLLEGGPPHDNVTVSAVSVDGSSVLTQTLSDGSFLLEGVEEGVVSITAYKAGFETFQLTDIAVLPGQTTILESPMTLPKPPASPTGVTASQSSGSSVLVSWTASVSPDVAGYNVYYGSRSDQVNLKANTNLVADSSFDVTGLERGVTYYFGVKAVDNDGLASPLSPSDGSLKAVIHPAWEKSVLVGGDEFNFPFDIAITVSGTTGYVSSRENACLLKIDFSDPDPYVSGQINLSGTSPVPTALAMNPASPELYVVDESQNKLFVFNTTNDTSGTTPFEVGTWPQNVIVSQDGSRIYVCNRADNVQVIDAATKEVLATIALGEDADPYGMAIVNNRLYVAGPWTNKVYMVDLDGGSANYHKVIASIPVGTGAYDVAARSDGAYIYVSHNTSDGAVSVIDTTSNTVVKTIAIKNEGEMANKNPKGMAVGGNVLYVLNWGDSTVTMINTQDNVKLDLGSPLLSGGNGPENLVVSPDGNKLYIVHSSAGSVEILSY